MNSGNGRCIKDDWRCKQTKQFCYVFLIFLLCAAMQVIAQSFFDQKMLIRLQQNHGEAAYQRGLALNSLLQDLRNGSEQEKLLEINRFFNRFVYVGDIELWRERDYWATPEEFVGSHQGDCEDYVIAKYFALRALGVAEKKLYLTYVKAAGIHVAHMVLTYFKTPESIPLVLDNYDLRILPANKRKDLLPVYSFNAKTLFLTNSSAGLGKQLPTDKVKNSKWTELLDGLEGATQ